VPPGGLPINRLGIIKNNSDNGVFHVHGTDHPEMDSHLRSRGRTLPPMDVLIAASCLHRGLGLRTLDRHFDHVPGFELHGRKQQG